MTLYGLLKFLHVVAVTIWVGGLITLFCLGLRLGRTGDRAVQAAVGAQTGFLSGVMFGPAFLITLATGIAMAIVGKLGFSPFWITWGFTGAILSFILGGVLTGGTARKMAGVTILRRSRRCASA